MRSPKFKTLMLLTGWLLSAAAVSGVTYAAFQTRKQVNNVSFSVKRVIYLDVSQSLAWSTGSPKFSVYLFGHETESACFANNAFMDNVDTNIYRLSIPAGFTNIIFVRHNSSEKTPSFGGLQTVDLDLGDNDCFTVAPSSSPSTIPIGGDGSSKYGGGWSLYSGGHYTHDDTP